VACWGTTRWRRRVRHGVRRRQGERERSDVLNGMSGIAWRSHQGQFGEDYVRVLATAAGITVSKCNLDVDGIDLLLALPDDVRSVRSPRIEVQVKTTSRLQPADGVFAFDGLNGWQFNKLAGPGFMVPRYLFLATVPPDSSRYTDLNHHGAFAQAHRLLGLTAVARDGAGGPEKRPREGADGERPHRGAAAGARRGGPMTPALRVADISSYLSATGWSDGARCRRVRHFRRVVDRRGHRSSRPCPCRATQRAFAGLAASAPAPMVRCSSCPTGCSNGDAIRVHVLEHC
jgi:hypothetical protein